MPVPEGLGAPGAFGCSRRANDFVCWSVMSSCLLVAFDQLAGDVLVQDTLYECLVS
jgi:hypothetical protein